MPLWPAAKMMDVVGVVPHAVVGFPVHPYLGPIFLWHTPKFPATTVFINGMPACAVGAMGYSVHIPQGPPVPQTPTNCSCWTRYLTNVQMVLTLTALTMFANMVIAAIAAFMPKPKSAEGFIRDVTEIDTSSSASFWSSVQANVSTFTPWPTWIKLLMPPLPWPGARGSTAVGSPNAQVNGVPLAFVAPLVATSCSDLPNVPNAMTLGFSNAMVGVSISDLVRGIAVHAAQSAVSYGVGKAASGLGLPGFRGAG
ncbi:MAG TPA: hypothetical protein VF590_06970 [Isosphaeraceae bacterium]|jgi:hypothetical protein